MFKSKIFSTAAEPVMEEKLIVNATFIHCQYCVLALLSHGDFTRYISQVKP